MMQMSLIIFLVGMSYAAGPWDQPDTPSRPRRPIASAAQQRLHTRRQLTEQIEQWRTEARQIKPHEAQQALKEIPNVGELEIMVGADWDQVTRLLINEMRNRRANRWEKVYVGRHLVALLSLAPKADLVRQMRLLPQAFAITPDTIRNLPESSLELPPLPKTKSDRDKYTKVYLDAIKRFEKEARERNVQDKRIVLINKSVNVLRKDFTSLLLQSGIRRGYQTVIERLTQQLRTADASFTQTVKALEEARLDEMDIGLAKFTQARLRILARRFAGPRQYIVYSKVAKYQLNRSDFEQVELDFQKSIENILSKLSERIESHRQRERSKRLERTPGPLQRTPGPTRGPSGADGG